MEDLEAWFDAVRPGGILPAMTISTDISRPASSA